MTQPDGGFKSATTVELIALYHEATDARNGILAGTVMDEIEHRAAPIAEGGREDQDALDWAFPIDDDAHAAVANRAAAVMERRAAAARVAEGNLG